MKPKIDWLNHSLEFIVVIIGILIAFQLEKCSDNRAQRRLVKSHLSQIVTESKENKNKLDASIKQITEQIVFCDSLLAQINGRRNPIEIRNQATKLLDLRNIDISTNAYNVLVQSGDIRFLNDYYVKRDIISMYESYENVERINNSIQNLYDNHFYPYMKTNFDLVNWDNFQIKSDEARELYYSKEFANTVSTYSYLLVAKKGTYQKQKEIIDDYLN